MIRVSVMYPTGDGATFDVEYYKTTHMDIVKRVLPGVVRTEVDQAINGPYLCVGHIYFESADDLNAAMSGPDAGEATADIPNFTNTQPVMQVGEIL